MLYKYSNFNENLILEKIINESIIYYSPDLRKILKRMKDNSVAINLLELEGSDIKPDITFVDLDKEGYLSFSTMRNAKKLITDKFPHIDYIDTKVDFDIADELFDLDKRGSARASEVTKKSRNSVSLGKFVNKLLPDKYNDKDREEFVNKFKASVEQGGERISVVEGKDIEFWYSSKNYKEKAGTLGNSCMAEKVGIFSIYTENPQVCKMVILTEDDKLIGRALVWKLSKIRKILSPSNKDNFGEEVWFMDRQYTIKDSDVEKLRNFAKSKGWFYKTHNNHSSYNKITSSEGEQFSAEMVVTVKPLDYNKFPYMDTFKRFNPSYNQLNNDDNNDSDYQGDYILDDTSGGYTEVTGGVYSEWYDRSIDEDEAVWSDGVDSYLERDRAVLVDRGSRRNRGWWPEDYDDIVYDEWISEYLHINDTVYSEYYNHHLWNETAVETVVEIYEDGDIVKDWLHEDDVKITSLSDAKESLWYSKFDELDEIDYILKELVRKDMNDITIPKILAVKVYKVVSEKDSIEVPVEITGIDYLSSVDAYALGYDIEDYNFEILDQYQYNESISPILDILLKRVISELARTRKYLDIESDEGLLKMANSLSERQEELETKKWSSSN